MKIEIEVDDALIDSLDPRIGQQLRADEGRRGQLARFAVEELLVWMSGRSTYQSLTQQHTEWVMKVLPIFFENKPPSTQQIFNSFSIPYGRASYISRVLLSREHTLWRAKGRSTLLAALNAKAGEAQKNVGKGEGIKRVEIYIDQMALRELEVLMEDLYEEDPQLLPTRTSVLSPGRHVAEIPSTHFNPLLQRLN